MKYRLLCLVIVFSSTILVWSQSKKDVEVLKVKFLSQDSLKKRDSIIYKNDIKVQIGSILIYHHPQITFERKLSKHFNTEVTLGLAQVDDFVMEQNALYWDTGHRSMDYRTFQPMPSISISSKYYFKEVFRGFALGPLLAYRPMRTLYNNPVSKYVYQEKYRYLDAGIQFSYLCKLFKIKRISMEVFLQGGYRHVKNEYITIDHGTPEKVNRTSFHTGFLLSGFNIGFLF